MHQQAAACLDEKVGYSRLALHTDQPGWWTSWMHPCSSWQRLTCLLSTSGCLPLTSSSSDVKQSSSQCMYPERASRRTSAEGVLQEHLTLSSALAARAPQAWTALSGYSSLLRFWPLTISRSGACSLYQSPSLRRRFLLPDLLSPLADMTGGPKECAAEALSSSELSSSELRACVSTELMAALLLLEVLIGCTSTASALCTGQQQLSSV